MATPLLMIGFIFGVIGFTEIKEDRAEKKIIERTQHDVATWGPDNPQSRQYRIGEINWKKLKKEAKP